ncbi:TPA: hypothetical protein ROU58_001458 [Raoultella ornithinolytica CD1_MRS_4]|nr:hypothetical protein [Raoultella ornithinolytica CD1_MRS_4]
MSQITVKDAPLSVQQAPEENNVVVDAKGRHIVIRELDMLEESRLIFAIGSERASNPVYVQAYALPAACAAEIDGEKFSVPANISQLEGRMAILGREGMNAIANKLYNLNSDDSAEKEAVKN